MPEASLATCQDCGKQYKVPSLERTYECKACGGVVGGESEPPPEPKRSRSAAPVRSRRRSSEEDDEDEEDRPRRPRKKQSSPVLIYAIMGLLAVGGLGWVVLSGDGTVEARTIGVGDLDKASDLFEEAWNAGEWEHVNLIVAQDKRTSISNGLAAAKRKRWADGMPKLTDKKVGKNLAESLGKSVAEATMEELATSVTFKTQDGSIFTRWQFHREIDTWTIYDLVLPLPNPEARAKEFIKTWADADDTTIEAFSASSKRGKMVSAYANVGERAGWPSKRPPLEYIGNDLNVFDGAYSNAKVKVTFKVEGDTWNTTWMFEPKQYDWFIYSFERPK